MPEEQQDQQQEQESQRTAVGFMVLVAAVCLVVAALCIRDGWFPKPGKEKDVIFNKGAAVLFVIGALAAAWKAQSLRKRSEQAPQGPPDRRRLPMRLGIRDQAIPQAIRPLRGMC